MTPWLWPSGPLVVTFRWKLDWHWSQMSWLSGLSFPPHFPQPQACQQRRRARVTWRRFQLGRLTMTGSVEKGSKKLDKITNTQNFEEWLAGTCDGWKFKIFSVKQMKNNIWIRQSDKQWKKFKNIWPYSVCPCRCSLCNQAGVSCKKAGKIKTEILKFYFNFTHKT